jgi:hypothetical protein
MTIINGGNGGKAGKKHKGTPQKLLSYFLPKPSESFRFPLLFFKNSSPLRAGAEILKCSKRQGLDSSSNSWNHKLLILRPKA